MLMLLVVLLMIRLLGLLNRPQFRRRLGVQAPLDPLIAKQSAPWYRTRAKPRWVGDEIVRMKAFAPKLGYVKLAQAFNRRFVDEYGMIVSASTVRRIL